MPADQRVLITHIFSNGPTARIVGNRTGGDTTNLVDTNVDFIAAGVVPGDVVRLTSPNTINGQAAVVKTVATTTLTFYVPVVGPVNPGDSYRVERARQATNVSPDVLRLEVRDYQSDLTKQVVIELSNTNAQYEGLFAPRDPVEIWIDDGDPATPAPSFPSSTTDTTTPVQDSRAFVGRIDSVERPTEGTGQTLVIVARNYAGDLLDTVADAVFINTYMLPKTPAGQTVFPNVAQALTRLFNGDDNTALTDQLDDYKAGKCGVMRDRATGRPTFALSTTDPSSGGATNPQGDIAFSTESFFDAYAKVAGVCAQLTAGLFQGEPLKFWVDDWTYHPRRQDATGVGVDDPRPPAGANTGGAGNPTINIKRGDEAQGAALNFSIVEGVNAVVLQPRQDSERTRNTIRVLGTRNDDAPVVIQQRQQASFRDAHGQPVLGRDRYGELGGVAQAKGFFDVEAAEAAATASLIRTRSAKDRRTITRTMAVEPGRSLAGSVVSVTAPSAGLNQSLGIAGVRHQWDARGLLSEFDLTYIRPGWDRLLAPLERSARDIIREDVWKAWHVVLMDVDASFDLAFKRVATHEYGTALKETQLFTVQNPPQVSYPTQGGGAWIPCGFRFYNGLLLICWRDPQEEGNGDFRILFQLLNAYDGSPAIASLAGDGIYSTMQAGGGVFYDGSGVAPTDVWVEAHVNAGVDPVVDPHLVVWVSGPAFIQRFRLRRLDVTVSSRDALTPFPVQGVDTKSGGRIFIAERDDGHIVANTVYVQSVALSTWIAVDLSDGGSFEVDSDNNLPSGQIAWALTGDRSEGGIAVYVLGTRATPTADHFLKLTRRWGQNNWDRTIGTGARNLSVRTVGGSSLVVGRLDVVPYTRFWFTV